MKKGNIFKQTLNTRYFGTKNSFFDKKESKNDKQATNKRVNREEEDIQSN